MRGNNGKDFFVEKFRKLSAKAPPNSGSEPVPNSSIKKQGIIICFSDNSDIFESRTVGRKMIFSID